MPPRMTYIASPIDQVVNTEELADAFDLLNQAKYKLLNGGVGIIYDPATAFKASVGSIPGPEIREVNLVALDQADSVLAIMLKGVASIGVPMEVEFAVQAGKAVAILTNTASWSLQYGGDVTNLALFPLTTDGMRLAMEWLFNQAVEVERRKGSISAEPLPFMVVRDSEVNLTPKRTYDGDAGWDLIVAEDLVIPAGGQVDVPCGVAVALPEWAFGRITGRSSTLRTRGLLINEGIIDAGYRGELFALARNMNGKDVAVSAGDRLAQLIIHANDSRGVIPVELDSLPPSDRGLAGFGSTGT
jgi:dUTP pyrophosphatase